MSRSTRADFAATERLSWSSLESSDAVEELARFVRGGGVVAFPTESSYALGADPASSEGVEAVFRIKRRPASKPLPVVVSGIEALASLGVDASADGLPALARAWPGPLTVILPLGKPLPAACGRKELAVRVPGHGRLRSLLARSGLALTATSANLAGGPPLLDSEDIAELARGERVRIIDQGPLAGGAPSTLVRLEGDRVTVLRRGALAVERLRSLASRLAFEDSFSAGAVEIPVDGSG